MRNRPTLMPPARIAAIAAVAATLACAATPAAARDRALVVGINLYPGIIIDRGNGVKEAANLGGAVFDAQSMGKAAVDIMGFRPEDVKLLTDAEATRERIVSEFESWLVQGTRPGERVLFFFAGHGAAVAVKDPDGSTRTTSAMVPADAKGGVGGEDEVGTGVQGLLLGPDMAQLLAKVADRKVTMIADSCFSGSVSRGARPGPVERDLPGVRTRTLTPSRPLHMQGATVDQALAQRIKAGARSLVPDATKDGRRDLAVWSAATTAQVTFDYPGREGGVFTQSLLDALRGKADPTGRGLVTAESALNYVRDEAKRICQAIGKSCSAGLTPDLIAPPNYRSAALVPFKSGGEPVVELKTSDEIGKAATQALSHKNDYEVTAEILPSTQLKLGQEVAFRVRSAEAGRLLVLDAGPDGKLTVIFPNPISDRSNKDGLIRANAPMVIPDATYGMRFTATDRGPGTLIVVVAEAKADIGSISREVSGFSPVKDARRAIQVVANELQEPVITPDLNKPNAAIRYGFVAIPYRVE